MENQPVQPSIPQTPTPQPQIPATQQIPTTQSSDINQSQAMPTEPNKPKSIKILAFLILLLTLSYIFFYEALTLIFYAVSLDLEKAFEHPVSGAFFRLFPLSGIPIYLAALSPILLLYAGLKMFDGSLKSWTRSFLFLLVLPIYNTFLIFFLTWQMSPSANNLAGENKELQMLSFTSAGVFSFIVNISPLIIMLAFLLIYRKKFIFPESPLSKNKKIIFLILVFLIIVPNYTFITNKYLGLLDKDFGYTNAQKQVSFTLHKIDNPPSGYTQIYEYTPEQEGIFDKSGAVKAMFETKEFLSDEKGFIILTQEKAKAGTFEELIDQFIKKSSREDPIEEHIEIVALPGAKDGKAAYVKVSIIQQLFYVSPDKTIINFVTLDKTDKEYLLEFAESIQ